MKRPSGGMGRESTVFYKRLADCPGRETSDSATTMGWLGYCLNFPLLRSAILCSRSSRQHTFQDHPCMPQWRADWHLTLTNYSFSLFHHHLFFLLKPDGVFFFLYICIMLPKRRKKEKRKNDHGRCSSDPSY